MAARCGRPGDERAAKKETKKTAGKVESGRRESTEASRERAGGGGRKGEGGGGRGRGRKGGGGGGAAPSPLVVGARRSGRRRQGARWGLGCDNKARLDLPLWELWRGGGREGGGREGTRVAVLRGARGTCLVGIRYGASRECTGRRSEWATRAPRPVHGVPCTLSRWPCSVALASQARWCGAGKEEWRAAGVGGGGGEGGEGGKEGGGLRSGIVIVAHRQACDRQGRRPWRTGVGRTRGPRHHHGLIW